jgi:hypothetical protein
MLTEDMIRRIQGADYYHDEEETRWPYPGAIIISITLLSWAVIGIVAYAAWGHFA